MPIANPEVYREMIKRAKDGGFAYPAINVTSSQTLNAAIKGFADAGSDGIIQASTGGAEFWSGQGIKNMVTGAARAEAAFLCIDAEEGVYPNAYANWTPALLRAAYNYQYFQKDPGAFAHNPKYTLQELYDSIEAVGGPEAVAGLVRP